MNPKTFLGFMSPLRYDVGFKVQGQGYGSAAEQLCNLTQTNDPVLGSHQMNM